MFLMAEQRERMSLKRTHNALGTDMLLDTWPFGSGFLGVWEYWVFGCLTTLCVSGGRGGFTTGVCLLWLSLHLQTILL